MSYNIGPKIGIDGEKEFRKSIKDINDAYKALDAETKAVTAAFDAQGDEQGKLEATSKQLQKQIDTQKEKMGLLEDAVKKASAKFGENSIEATRLRGALYDTQATVSNLESELKDAKSRLDRAGDSMDDFADSADDAGDAAIDLGDIIKGNLVSDLILDGLREMGELVKDFALESLDSAAEVQAATAQFEQTFGAIEKSAKDALDNVSDDTGIAATRIQGIFTTLYGFAKNAGFEQAQALNISSRAMLAAADNAAYYDKTMEEAAEQVQAFIKGNYANDAALGISATETTRSAKANELYAKSFQELSEAQKVDTLLAMVEAGNAASGAIGQAARESDSWANVTAELAEVFRLLQANAGKPALQKLIPIIQRITKEGYKLIEDTDWDKFGDTVEKIADGVIERGPGVVKAIASITAGIVAMKAVTKVGEFATMAQSFLSVGAAAQTAGNMVAASGALVSVTPWGLAAAAIGATVALVVAAAGSAKTAAGELRSAMDDLETSMEDANTRYEETKADVDGAAYAAEHYVGRLRELEQAGLDTAVAQKEYEMIVERLNELIPDLNLSIDEQTGLIEGNTEALYSDIEAWKKNATAKALQDKFTDVLEAQGRAQAEVIEAQAELNMLTDEAADLGAKLKKTEERLNKAYADRAEAEDECTRTMIENGEASAEAMARYSEAEALIASLNDEYLDLAAAIDDNAASQNALGKEISKAEKTVASFEDEVSRAEKSLHLFNQESEDGVDGQEALNAALEEVEQAIRDLTAEYEEAKTEARKSIDSQIGLFDELSNKSDWSAAKIIKNWESQRTAFDNYSANLQKAVDMGLDQALVQQLADGSAESMLILNALVNDVEINVGAINTAFGGLNESKDNVSSAMGAVQTEFNKRMDALEEDAKDAGKDTAAGIAEGMRSGIPLIASASTAAAKGVLNAYKKAMDQHSPSRLMERTTGDTVMGGVIGIEKNAAKFEQSMEDMAFAGHDAFLEARIDRAESYPEMVSATTVSNRSSTTNYGGVAIQVYQQPGESADDLAYRLLDMIQHEVEVKEAAF